MTDDFYFYNCHIHTFTAEDVPERFLPLALVKILKTKIGFICMSKLLRGIIPFSDKDMFDRYVRFIKISRLGDQDKIFEECKKYYPDDTRFIVLAMDMAYMGAGQVSRNYEKQLEKLGELAKKENILPFMHVDPRRKNVLELLKYCVEKLNFKGIKLYPPLGYFPYDDRLDPIYEYCEEKNLPVLVHCSPYNPVRFKGKKTELIELLKKSKKPIETKGKNRRQLCKYFTDPDNYLYVVEKYKKLRICLAHFGSEYYWKKYIFKPGDENNWMIKVKNLVSSDRYNNFFTDISFTVNKEVYFSLLKILLSDKKIRQKVLFGSDFYMVETLTDERMFGLHLRAFIGETYFKEIAVDNPLKFLYGK